MTLFATAYRLGIEPFFFSSVNHKEAKTNYAKILELFVIFGALILLIVVVFVDVLKLILIPNEAYWEAMSVVPILLLAYLFLGIYHNLSSTQVVSYCSCCFFTNHKPHYKVLPMIHRPLILIKRPLRRNGDASVKLMVISLKKAAQLRQEINLEINRQR